MIMEKIKVGLLPLYIKLYDDYGVDRTLLDEFHQLVIEKLENAGLEVISAPVCRIKSEFKSAVENFEKENANAIITLHLAYSPSLECVDALCDTALPIDVYDAVTWMSVTALSEQSIALGSMPVECPDFTRGKYKTRKTVDVFEFPVIKK